MAGRGALLDNHVGHRWKAVSKSKHWLTAGERGHDSLACSGIPQDDFTQGVTLLTSSGFWQ